MTGKRILIVLAVLILIFVIVVLFFIFSRNSGGNSNLGDLTPVPTQAGLDFRSSNPSPAPLTPENSQKYSSDNFTFSYPNGTSISGTGKEENSETAVIDLGNNALIEVSSMPSSTGALSRIQQIMSAQNFPSTSVTVGSSIPATRYKGFVQFPSDKLQQIVTLLEWNSNVYKIQMTYPGEITNPQFEQMYYSVASSFAPF